MVPGVNKSVSDSETVAGRFGRLYKTYYSVRRSRFSIECGVVRSKDIESILSPIRRVDQFTEGYGSLAAPPSFSIFGVLESFPHKVFGSTRDKLLADNTSARKCYLVSGSRIHILRKCCKEVVRKCLAVD